MEKYYQIRGNEADLEIGGMLFYEDEKQRAKAILNALKGMRIISAQELLDKCKDALMQDCFTG